MEKCDNHNSLPNNYFELKENIENILFEKFQGKSPFMIYFQLIKDLWSDLSNIINKHIIVPLFVIWWNEEECVYYFTQKQISNIVSLSDKLVVNYTECIKLLKNLQSLKKIWYFTLLIENDTSLKDTPLAKEFLQFIDSLREGRLLSSLEWKFNDMDTNKQMIHWSHEQKTLFFHNYYKELDKVLYEAVEEVIAPYLEYIKQLSNSWTST